MKKLLFFSLVTMFSISVFAQETSKQSDNAQDQQKIQALSQTFSRYLVNNINIHLKGVRYEDVVGKLKRGLAMQFTVVLNKKGSVEDVIVNKGINEIFDGDFRDPLFLIPKEEFENITIKGVKSYIPIILDVKMSACDRALSERMDDEGLSKRWKKFKEDDEKMLQMFPKLAEYKSVKDVCNSSVWFIYYSLCNLKITVADPSLLNSDEVKKQVERAKAINSEE